MTERDKRKVVNEWLSDNYKQLRINIIHKLAGYNNPLAEDLLASTIEQFLKKDTDIVYRIVSEEKPEYYITRMAALNLKSSTSNFYTHYRKPAMNIREFFINRTYEGVENTFDMEDEMEGDIFDKTPQIHKDLRKAMKQLKEYNLYYADLISKLYIQGWSHIDYCDHYEIPIKELRYNVTAARNRLKLILKQIQNDNA